MVSGLVYLRDHRGRELRYLVFNDYPDLPLSSGGTSPPWRQTGEDLLGKMLPGALFEANAVSLSRMYTDYLIAPLRDSDGLGSFTQRSALEAEITRIRSHPFTQRSRLVAVNFLGGVNTIAWRFRQWQTQVALALVACRLEGFQREHGAYPETLTGLTLSDGHPLPLDPMNNQPLGYRRTPDGRYALWSVGPDGVDDGGTRAPALELRKVTMHGDLVWDFLGKK